MNIGVTFSIVLLCFDSTSIWKRLLQPGVNGSLFVLNVNLFFIAIEIALKYKNMISNNIDINNKEIKFPRRSIRRTG